MDAKVSFSLTFGHRPGRRTFRAVCLLFLLSATPIFAQTVQPLIDENVVKGPGKAASGKIEYINDSTQTDRKSTRLNSSHRCISYAVFCLKKKSGIAPGDSLFLGLMF